MEIYSHETFRKLLSGDKELSTLVWVRMHKLISGAVKYKPIITSTFVPCFYPFPHPFLSPYISFPAYFLGLLAILDPSEEFAR